MNTSSGTPMAPYNVPQGMALVPIEMLAYLKQPQATDQPDSAIPNA
jgi:hypothetical protein